MSQQEANRIVRAAQRMRRSRGLLKVALPTAAALGAGAAVASGTIPGGANGTTITGCYADPAPNEDGFRPDILVNDVPEAPGTLRLIDPTLAKPAGVNEEPARECVKDETQITWNQSGPQGPQGPAGPQGAAGGQGAAGSAGSPGSPLIGGTSFGLTNNSGQTFLKIDGIDGESTDKQHKGDINIESFSLAAQGAIGSASTGAGAGKTSIQSFTITKALDKSSPALMQDAAAGTHIGGAELSFAHKSAGKEQTYLKYDFSNILISSISDGQSPGGAPTEQITFAFQKLQETLIGQNGKSIASVGWNVATNQKF
jgi:type VI secretion system secreted protein Hcp